MLNLALLLLNEKPFAIPPEKILHSLWKTANGGAPLIVRAPINIKVDATGNLEARPLISTIFLLCTEYIKLPATNSNRNFADACVKMCNTAPEIPIKVNVESPKRM